MSNQKKLHEQILYPMTRVRTATAGGSGTIIYSQKDPRITDNEEYETFVLTNHHVIDNAIEIKKVWDSVLKREIKKEFTQIVSVEIFVYKYLSEIVGGTKVDADIVAYDDQEDLALLRLRTINPADYVATLLPKIEMRKIKLFDRTIACGCSLGHPPVPTEGWITGLYDEIDNKIYWMSTAQIIYGNSGGAMFLADTGQFIGVPARIAVSGWQDAVTHMGYFIPMDRVYNFLKEHCYHFIYDPNTDSIKCEKDREKKQKENLRNLLLKGFGNNFDVEKEEEEASV